MHYVVFQGKCGNDDVYRVTKWGVCLPVCTGADGLGLEVQNVVDISNQVNCELAMRISSNIKNGDDFYTDLNGLQVHNIYVFVYWRSGCWLTLSLQSFLNLLCTLSVISPQTVMQFKWSMVLCLVWPFDSHSDSWNEVLDEEILLQLKSSSHIEHVRQFLFVSFMTFLKVELFTVPILNRWHCPLSNPSSCLNWFLYTLDNWLCVYIYWLKYLQGNLGIPVCSCDFCR